MARPTPIRIPTVAIDRPGSPGDIATSCKLAQSTGRLRLEDPGSRRRIGARARNDAGSAFAARCAPDPVVQRNMGRGVGVLIGIVIRAPPKAMPSITIASLFSPAPDAAPTPAPLLRFIDIDNTTDPFAKPHADIPTNRIAPRGSRAIGMDVRPFGRSDECLTVCIILRPTVR